MVHFPPPLGLTVLMVRTLVKRPLVVTVHGNPQDVQSVIADRDRLPAMKRACRAVAVGRYSLRAMCERYWSVCTDLVRPRS